MDDLASMSSLVIIRSTDNQVQVSSDAQKCALKCPLQDRFPDGGSTPGSNPYKAQK